MERAAPRRFSFRRLSSSWWVEEEQEEEEKNEEESGRVYGPLLDTTLRDFLTTDESYSRDILF